MGNKAINFWNGNKSPMRQCYELETLTLALSDEYDIFSELTGYPLAEDEGAVFENGTDVLATVAGNKKFEGKAFNEIKVPLCWGILGWRKVIVATERLDEFQCITEHELKQKVMGVPKTWVDAELFRSNGYKVLEEGSLEDVLGFIKDGRCDYMTLGINEAEDTLANYPYYREELALVSDMLVYYPFPLVYYVHPEETVLADKLREKLQVLKDNGKLAELFLKHYGQYISSQHLEGTRLIHLNNPFIPQSYVDLVNPSFLYELV
ncbi:transporter substrate-binding domain-containing protein [Vibrio parahaemolyticus]|nr:transporter substrate-binding domain-containing protein [Vibrio parahaemolyticus]